MASFTGFCPVDSEIEDKPEGFKSSLSKLFKRTKASTANTLSPSDASADRKEDESFCVLSLTKEDSPGPSVVSSSSLSRNDADFSQGRTPVAVLRMVKNLLAVKSATDEALSEVELRKHWVPDEKAFECFECNKKFSTFLRRHHCRVCGLIFCSKCCNLEIRGKAMGFVDDLRVCNYCYKMALTYLQSVNGADPGKDARTWQEDLQACFDDSQSDICSIGRSRRASMCLYDDQMRSLPTTPLPPISSSTSLATMEHQHPLSGATPMKECRSHQISAEERRTLVQDSAQLKYLRNLLTSAGSGVELKVHRNRLKTFHQCCTGKDIVDWLISNDRAVTRIQASAIAQALLEAGYLESLTNKEPFSDSLALYRPEAGHSQRSHQSKPSFTEPPLPGKDEPQWVRQVGEETGSHNSLHSTFGMNTSGASLADLHVAPNNFFSSPTVIGLDEHFTTQVDGDTRPVRPLDLPVSEELRKLPEDGLWAPGDTPGAIERDPDAWLGETSFVAEEELKSTKKALNEAYRAHELKLLHQLMSLEGLSSSWTDVMLNMVHSTVMMVKPDVRQGDDIDVRSYIKVKKVPGGEREESRVVSGLVISKSVAHKTMYSNFKRPRIILISGGIDFTQGKDKLTSFDSLLLEEADYYRRTVSKIDSWQPDIVICGLPVSCVAQEALRQRAISLVLNVKAETILKLARLTGAEIVISVDSQTAPPHTGTCSDIYVQSSRLENGKIKTMMFFEQKEEPASTFFTSLVLRGGSCSELAKVKRILHFMVLVAYSWRFERSFLCDELATVLDFNACSESDSDNEEMVETNCGSFDIVGTRLSSAHEAIEDFRLVESTDSDAVFLECDQKRKREKDKLVKSQVTDQSDPLQSTKLHQVKSAEKLQVVEIAAPRVGVQSILSELALSSSPLLTVPLPYLETNKGKNSKLRKFFPAELYMSKLLANRMNRNVESKKRVKNKISNIPSGCAVITKERHPFFNQVLSSENSERKMVSHLADFRARGGTYSLRQSEGNEARPVESPEEEDGGQDIVPDPLDPRSHQKLQVLFSSHSVMSLNMPHPCVPPWLMSISFYGKSDLTLGSFLERLCFRAEDLSCPSEICRTSMTSHRRRFVHADACIHVILRKLDTPLPSRDGVILVWTYCKKCKSISPVIPLSDEAWNLSFAKYLELRFYGNLYKRRGSDCPHKLHVDHYQYFGMGGTVASMKYTPITLREVCLPSVNIYNVPLSFLQKYTIEEIKHLTQVGSMVFTAAKEWLQGLGSEFSGSKHEAAVQGLLLQLDAEKSLLKDRVEDVQILLSSDTLAKGSTCDTETRIELLYEILDREVLLKKLLVDVTNTWNLRIQDLVQVRKKEERTNRSGSKLLLPTPTSAVAFDFRTESSESDYKSAGGSDVPVAKPTTEANSQSSPTRSRKHLRNSSSGGVIPPKDTWREGRTRSDSYSPARQFAEEGRKDKIPAEIFKPPSSRDSSPENFRNSVEKKVSVSAGSTTPSSLTQSSTMKNLFSGLLSSNQVVPIQLPFLANEHHMLPPNGRIPLSIFELEPSSIIAYSLASTDYDTQLASLLSHSSHPLKGDGPLGKNDTQKSFNPLAKEGRKSSDSKKDPDSPTGEHIDESDSSGNPAHVEIQFPDPTSNFYCKIYFAAAFRQLRTVLMPSGEDSFIRSLSRCAPWAADGGKSGSTFCKTLDDRFVLKHMNRNEVESFLQIAPSYVSYVTKSLTENRPTALCKILGAFKIVYKNNVTGTSSKQDLLVMENLFYQREISATYDLKGSVRNRMVSTTGRSVADLVMLDENLLQVTVDNPFYIRPHSSSVLKVSLSRDTQFLASHLIMDYSLLVGVDDKNDEFVVGIIDFVRTFTWDKKLETFVKSSGFLGGQGKQPTIVSPDIYRSRFCDAMSRYFLAVPDRWTGLSSTADC